MPVVQPATGMAVPEGGREPVSQRQSAKANQNSGTNTFKPTRLGGSGRGEGVDRRVDRFERRVRGEHRLLQPVHPR